MKSEIKCHTSEVGLHEEVSQTLEVGFHEEVRRWK